MDADEGGPGPPRASDRGAAREPPDKRQRRSPRRDCAVRSPKAAGVGSGLLVPTAFPASLPPAAAPLALVAALLPAFAPLLEALAARAFHPLAPGAARSTSAAVRWSGGQQPPQIRARADALARAIAPCAVPSPAAAARIASSSTSPPVPTASAQGPGADAPRLLPGLSQGLAALLQHAAHRVPLLLAEAELAQRNREDAARPAASARPGKSTRPAGSAAAHPPATAAIRLAPRHVRDHEGTGRHQHADRHHPRRPAKLQHVHRRLHSVSARVAALAGPVMRSGRKPGGMPRRLAPAAPVRRPVRGSPVADHSDRGARGLIPANGRGPHRRQVEKEVIQRGMSGVTSTGTRPSQVPGARVGATSWPPYFQ